MKYCAQCNTELPEPIFEYGDLRSPVCFHCFIDPSITSSSHEERIRELEEEISEMCGEIDGHQVEIFELEDQICQNRNEIRALQANAPIIPNLKMKLASWINGDPIKVPNVEDLELMN